MARSRILFTDMVTKSPHSWIHRKVVVKSLPCWPFLSKRPRRNVNYFSVGRNICSKQMPKMVKILEAAWISQLFLPLTFGQLLQHGFLSDTQNMGMWVCYSIWQLHWNVLFNYVTLWSDEVRTQHIVWWRVSGTRAKCLTASPTGTAQSSTWPTTSLEEQTIQVFNH